MSVHVWYWCILHIYIYIYIPQCSLSAFVAGKKNCYLLLAVLPRMLSPVLWLSLFFSLIAGSIAQLNSATLGRLPIQEPLGSACRHTLLVLSLVITLLAPAFTEQWFLTNKQVLLSWKWLKLGFEIVLLYFLISIAFYCHEFFIFCHRFLMY